MCQSLSLLVDELVGDKATSEQAEFCQVRAEVSSQFEANVEELMGLTSARNVQQGGVRILKKQDSSRPVSYIDGSRAVVV